MGRQQGAEQERVGPISLGAQVGGKQADAATVSHITALQRILRECCKGPYSSEVDEFAFVLRVDGDIWHWDFEGPDKLRLSRKGRYITVDVGVPKVRWEGRDAKAIRQFLAEGLEQALGVMLIKLGKAKIPLSGNLRGDFDSAIATFLRE